MPIIPFQSYVHLSVTTRCNAKETAFRERKAPLYTFHQSRTTFPIPVSIRLRYLSLNGMEREWQLSEPVLPVLQLLSKWQRWDTKSQSSTQRTKSGVYCNTVFRNSDFRSPSLKDTRSFSDQSASTSGPTPQ